MKYLDIGKVFVSINDDNKYRIMLFYRKLLEYNRNKNIKIILQIKMQYL